MCYKVLLSVFIIFLIATNLNAQQGITASGSTIISSTGTISYSIGQVDYISTPIANSGSLTQGLQQVFNELPFTYIANLGRSTSITVWPNPVVDYLNIKINGNKELWGAKYPFKL